jgi:hypothetical protein
MACQIDSHLKVCKGEGSNLLQLLLPQLQAVASEASDSTSRETAPEDVDVEVDGGSGSHDCVQ